METPQTTELSESEQSYIETIHSLIEKHGYARVIDIAAALDVKPPSVTNMLQKLDEQKFVIYTRYRGVILTSKGKVLARTMEKRHRALRSFLIMIGVSEENAEKHACEIEHKVNRETIEKLGEFMEFLQSASQTPSFLEHFEHKRKTGKHAETC